ncbi:hypothetical protein PSHT_11128 [Puccinia striiformis]|uniref:Uncharacterized protein n=1 Tax=Puccinia striiformis TaxID=27350 RepID=A0A2S4V559_9BASI|nr:hypothetical protein PSHT_11128 [Puccinia striiformis]
MAAEEPPDHVPSTPPNTSNDPPDVPQSSRCESSCLCTPISRPGFIATQSDSCGALPLRATQPRQRPMIPNRDTFPAEETSNDILEVPDSNTDSSWPRRAAKANQKSASDAYACRWCDKERQKASCHMTSSSQPRRIMQTGSSEPNDGDLPPDGEEDIPLRLRAAFSHPKAQSTPNNSGTIVAYTTRGRFDNSTLTKILIIWLIQQSLLWLRMEDFHLRLAFDHAIVSSQLPSRVWAAAHAHQLYLEQRSQVIKLIKVGEQAMCEPGWEANDEDEYVASDMSGVVSRIDYICQRIASNPQKQAEWKLWAGKLGYTGRGAIGGFGIRWNIAYDSRQRAYEGRRVIKQLLENKSDKCGGQSAAKHFFNSYELCSREWEDANSLNQVLKA